MPDQPTPDPNHRLSDGREDLGDSLAHPIPREQHDLGQSFLAENQQPHTLADEFANPRITESRTLGEAFADPNSQDDRKLGEAFAATNSSAKKHHKPLKEHLPHKPANTKVLTWIIAGVVILFLLVLLIGFLPRHERNKETAQRANQARNARPVIEAARVERSTDGAGLVVPGTTAPYNEALIYARATGYLKHRYVDIGDHVHKGQLLAIIDAPDLDQQVDQAREQLRQAQAQQAQQEAQLALTKVTVDRYRALVARGVFSRQDGDQQETNYQAQIANVASAARNVEAFQANLRRVIALQSYERVTSPFDGVITQRNVDEGAYISTTGAAGSSAPTPMQTAGLTNGSSQTTAQTNTAGSSGMSNSLATPSTGGSAGGPLFAVSQVNQLLIYVSVPEGYANMVSPGQVASLHFQEFPNNDFFGKVSRTAFSLDQNTRTLLTQIVVDNRAGHLLSGMYAVVTFPPRPQSSPGNTANASTQTGPVVISGDAIAIRNDQPVVAVIQAGGDGDGTVHLQPVVLGRDFGATVEIDSGLRPGELIANTFTDQTVEGAKVQVKEDKKAEKQLGAQPPPSQNMPPGGSTQYGDPGIVDQNMQGQNAKPSQKKSKNGKQTKAAGPNKGNHQ